MDAEEIERIRHTPGSTEMGAGQECSLTAWRVDHKTGEIIPLGVVSYGAKSRWKRLRYRILRRMGRI